MPFFLSMLMSVNILNIAYRSSGVLNSSNDSRPNDTVTGRAARIDAEVVRRLVERLGLPAHADLVAGVHVQLVDDGVGLLDGSLTDTPCGLARMVTARCRISRSI